MPKHIPKFLTGRAGKRSRIPSLSIKLSRGNGRPAKRLLRLAVAAGLVLGGGVATIVGGSTVGAAACPTPSTDLGSTTLTLNVPVTATYTIWTRMKAPSTSANSVNLQVDSNTCFSVGGGSLVTASWNSGSGNWVRYQDGVTSNTISMSLNAGNHTFKYIGTQAEVEVDRIILSSDTSCTPTGTGDNCQSGDATNPTVNLTAPANGTTVTGPVTFQATASDASGISKIEFLVDGVVVSTTNNASSAQYSWSSTAVANGAHTVAARATDTKNNTATSGSVSVTVNNPTPCTGTPSVPGNLRVTATASNSVSLAWNASTPAAGCTLQEYRLYRNGTQVATPSGTTYTDTGLTPATAYNYTIAAVDAANHASAQSSAITGTTAADTTAPSQPASLRTTLTSATAVALAWNASTDNTAIKDYVVYRNGTQVGVSTTTAFTDNALAPSTSYNFTVRARDTANNLSTVSSTLAVTTLSGSGANKGDLDSNGTVTLTDLSILLSHWNQNGVPITQGDINASGKVDLTDLSILLSNWGKSV